LDPPPITIASYQSASNVFAQQKMLWGRKQQIPCWCLTASATLFVFSVRGGCFFVGFVYFSHKTQENYYDQWHSLCLLHDA
jgi:uncharacterized membrane protein YsdA (DUF1294 family)